MESAWSEHKEVNFLRPWTWRSISEFYKIQNGGTMLKNSSDFLFTPEMWKSYIKNVSVSIECYLWVFMTSLIANSYLNLQVQYSGSKKADRIFKNNGRISTKCSPTGLWVTDYEFIVGFTTFNMADPRWRMKFLKITVKSVQNAYPRVFGIADYKFIDRFTK